jgi:hypothetical protein
MSGPVAMNYLAEVATDRRQVVQIATGMTALARLLIGMRAEETGVTPEDTLAELGRRVQEVFSTPD